MSEQWKVLIADDEFIIREGIRESVDWEQLGMQVVGEAEDGEEALELAIKHEVHILLVDLNMPIMNGMTLMKRLREQELDCRIVIITGHDEFNYAQEAIRLNVDDYLLKPVNPATLKKVLENLKLQIESQVQQNKHLDLASKQINKNLALLRERFCLEWIEGNMMEEEIVEQLLFLKLPPISPNWLGVIRWPELYTQQPIMKENDRQLFLFAIENIVAEVLLSYERVMFRDQSGLMIVALWGELPDETISEMEKMIQTCLKININLHFQRVEGKLKDFNEAFRICKTNVYKETQISPLIRRARQYMRDHYSDRDISLESFANALQVSPIYLSRMLKQELGSSFIHLITQMRIKKAIQLLNATDLPIHEIAEQLGYDTQHYFSTAFKKVVGVSPNQYRKGSAFPEDLSDS
jgi:two-component system response regulator YesN